MAWLWRQSPDACAQLYTSHPSLHSHSTHNSNNSQKQQDMAKKKVVVAFSGGLDTSYTVMKLANDGYDVYAACANTGGFSPEQLKKNEENAYKLGAVQYVTLDVTHEYYERSLKYMIFGNVLRNNCYPISVSSERIFQAIAIARYANEIGADAIAHGSTGAGNDQIRFDMTFLVMAPGVEIITLTRDKALSRKEEVDYLNAHGFRADFAKLKYSYNVGIWGTSICGGELLDPTQGLPEEAYLKHATKNGEEELRITFEKRRNRGRQRREVRRQGGRHTAHRGDRRNLCHRPRLQRGRHDNWH